MIKALIRTILKFFFSLLLLLLAAHFILVHLPGDPSVRFVSIAEHITSSAEQEESIRQTLMNRGVLLPDFYFSIHSAALPSLYFKTYKPEEKRNIKQMAYHFGNPETIENFLNQLKRCRTFFSDDSAKIIYRQMLTNYCAASCITPHSLHKLQLSHPENVAVKTLITYQNEMHKQRRIWKKFIPHISFHPDNRFHRYVFGDGNNPGLIHGHLGLSWQTRMPVADVIFAGLKTTIPIALFSLLISMALSIVIGMKAGSHPGSVFDKISSHSLFILYSIPVFWLAVMLLVVFSNPHVLNWFPSSGIQPADRFPEGTSFLNQMISTIPYLILPLICFVLPSLAFMARTLRAATAEVMQQEFIRTARAKGLAEKTILRKHVFRNVLLTVITLFTLAWPALLSGSVVIESIFSVPGMGLLTYQAVQQQDYPVLAGVFITTGAITLATFMMGDLLYRLADPRLKT